MPPKSGLDLHPGPAHSALLDHRNKSVIVRGLGGTRRTSEQIQGYKGGTDEFGFPGRTISGSAQRQEDPKMAKTVVQYQAKPEHANETND